MAENKRYTNRLKDKKTGEIFYVYDEEAVHVDQISSIVVSGSYNDLTDKPDITAEINSQLTDYATKNEVAAVENEVAGLAQQVAALGNTSFLGNFAVTEVEVNSPSSTENDISAIEGIDATVTSMLLSEN